MRTDESQCELSLDAPLAVVIGCRSEADAVRKCLRIALRRLGRDQKTVARMCGWKTDSCLSEIASESNKRALPAAKAHRFAVATGCNLVDQYCDYVESESRRKGLLIQRDEADMAADACLAAWEALAA